MIKIGSTLWLRILRWSNYCEMFIHVIEKENNLLHIYDIMSYC